MAVEPDVRLPKPLRATRDAAQRGLDGLDGLGRQSAFYVEAAAGTPRVVGRYRKEVLRLLAEVAFGSGALAVIGGTVVIVVFMTFFTGLEVGQQGYQSLNSLGAAVYTGFISAYFNTREIAPIIAAIALSATVGCGFTAQLGAMRVSEEIDALETLAVPSIPFLVTTRLIAGFVAVIPLYVMGLLASYFSTRIITTKLFGQSAGTYDHYFMQFLPHRDIFISFGKVMVFAVIIILTHCYYGYTAKGGPAGVGVAVGRAVRFAITSVVAVGLLLDLALYGTSVSVRIAGMKFSRYQLYGVAMIAVVAAFVALCLAYFNQAFTPVAEVTLHIPRAGLQVLEGSDVKVRGLIIGSVKEISSDGDGATLTLHLDPDQAERLPDNVSARLIPKTIFGEKYVDLLLPETPSGRTLADGGEIPEDRTTPTLEINQALNDLLPLLRTVQPAQLNMTLTALATAVQGRGEQLGATIDQLDAYFRQVNPHLPALQHDVRALVGVARTYEEAAGPLMEVLGNLTVTATTVVQREQQLAAFLGDVAGAADATRDLIARNETNIVRVNKVSRPVLELLARYSPEYPCFFRGYAGLVPRIHAALPDKLPGSNRKNKSAAVVIEFVPSFPSYTYPLDLPEFSDTRGPSCYGLPKPPLSQPRIQFKDGTEDDPRFSQAAPVGAQSTATTPLPTGYSPGMGSAGTAEETAAMSSLLGPVLGVPSADVPDLATLLFGPMGRGSSVELS